MKNQNHYIEKPYASTVKALIILIICIVLTVIATLNTKRDEDIESNYNYKVICNDLKIKIDSRLHAHAQLLRSGSAFFSASQNVRRDEWKNFNEREKITKNLPGLQGVGFSIIIPKNKLQQHIQDIRKEGFPNYIVKPTGNREVYTSIIYLEPFSGRNLKAFGYDMFSEPTRRKAMEISRDSDIAMLSGKVKLVQEINKDIQAGVLMYVPVYNKGFQVNTVTQRRVAIVGWVYSPFRMNDLMQGILGYWDINQLGRIHMQVYDDTISANSILFDSQPHDTLNHIDSHYHNVTQLINFNGKKWILHFTQSHEQISRFNSKVLIILFCGFAISFLIFFLTLSLFNTRYRAHKIAERLTAELKESEAKYKDLVQHSPNIIYKYSNIQGGLFWSEMVNNMLGYSLEELHANPFLWVNSIHPDDKIVVQKAIEDNETGLDSDIEYRIKSKSGKWIWLRDHFVHKTQIGEEIIIEGHASDITDRKHAEEEMLLSQAFLNNVIEHCPNSMWISDEQGTLIRMNQACRDILNLSNDDVVGKYNILRDNLLESQGLMPLVKDVFEKGFSTRFVTSYDTATIKGLSLSKTTKLILDVNISPVFDKNGKVTNAIIQHIDITENKLAELKIKQQNQELIKLNADKDLFVTILAHDLKSPFSSILGFMELLKNNIRKYSIDKIENQIKTVYNSTQHTYELLIDLLNWARTQSGKLEFEPQMLMFSDICDEVIENMKLNADNKKITIHHFSSSEINMHADKNMIISILRNLVSNAIKFCNIGGKITIYV